MGDADIPMDDRPMIAKAVTLQLRGAVDKGQKDFFDDGLSTEAAAWVSKIVQLAERSKGGRREVGESVVLLKEGREITYRIVSVERRLPS